MTLELSSTIMRAACICEIGKPSVIRIYHDIAIPKIQPNEVLIKVAAVAVSILDVMIRAGMSCHTPMFPYIPGNNASGTIVKVGDWVRKDYQVGERVATFMNVRTGASADYAAVNTSWIIRIPKDFSLRKAACLGNSYMIAYRALFQMADAKPEEYVLVHGCYGGIGLAALQLAKTKGLIVIGTAGTREDLAMLRVQGFHHCLNHTVKGYENEIVRICHNQCGPKIIIEMRADENLDTDLNICCMGATICIVENRGSVDINPRKLMTKEVHIAGVVLHTLSRAHVREMKAGIETGVRLGHLNPYTSFEYKFDDIQEAHKQAGTDEGSKGDVVVIL